MVTHKVSYIIFLFYLIIIFIIITFYLVLIHYFIYVYYLLLFFFRVKLSKDQNNGRAWGQLIWNGRPSGNVQRITCGKKSQWSLVEFPDYTTNFEEKMLKQLEEQIKERN